ncbi:unnamed protein product, partial [Phaeothamnion confervicola]
MDRAVKIIMVFRVQWFDTRLHGAICADSIVPEFWFRVLPIRRRTSCVGDAGSSGHGSGSGDGEAVCLVVGFAASDKADRLSAMGAAPAMAAALGQLDEMFATEISRIPATACFLRGRVQDWGDEPFVRGGYSYPRPGFRAAAPAALAAPVGGRLFFAGEHTNAHAGMSVHAAYDTGTRAAEEVLAAI